MGDTIIKAEGLGKRYFIGHEKQESYTAMRDVIVNNVKGFGKNVRKLFNSEKSSIAGDVIEEFWALKNLDFEIKQGDAVGIIGHNGAGKSTLLKVLSRITEPTTGMIEINGRMASLLEVGTGFHPELSGRENIFLNGAILGMTRLEIKRKFDEIVDFSGVERFLDTPVKRYSSGMYVRLAFAVAAHLESEILVIDEVLAVGDAEFQRKCLGKMGEVSKGEGRTVLFVSHNMSAVKALCNKGMLLKGGQISYMGSTSETLKEYLAVPVEISGSIDFLKDTRSRRGNGEVRFTKVVVNDGELSSDPTRETRIRFFASVLEDVPCIYFTFSVLGSSESYPITNGILIELSATPVGKGTDLSFELTIPANTFRVGFFPLYLWIGKKGELAAENYHYDCIDGLFNLNFATQKSLNEIGYDPLNPNGLVNINYNVENKIFR